MLLNIFTYKGPSYSLLGPWVTCGYLVNNNDFNKELESFIPSSRYLFSYRKDLIKYESLLLNSSINIKTINSYDINTLGDLAIYNSYKQIRASAYSVLKEEDSLVVNYINVKNRLFWYERLCIIYAVFIRHQYLQKLSKSRPNLFNLDSNLDAHLDLLSTYKYLPPIYIIDKCLVRFSDIHPKPFWFKREIDFINNNT
jgi:hypothetical protein